MINVTSTIALISQHIISIYTSYEQIPKANKETILNCIIKLCEYDIQKKLKILEFSLSKEYKKRQINLKLLIM